MFASSLASYCLCLSHFLSAILNLDNTVVDLETLQALYENVSNAVFVLSLAAKCSNMVQLCST